MHRKGDRFDPTSIAMLVGTTDNPKPNAPVAPICSQLVQLIRFIVLIICRMVNIFCLLSVYVSLSRQPNY